MVDLIAKAPCAGLLPVQSEKMLLEDVDLGCITSIAPFDNQTDALSQALLDAHGFEFPGPNKSTRKGDARIIWFGHSTALLAGVQPDAGLESHAALTDQSDAWASVVLSGPYVSDVMARLTPVDLRPDVFSKDHCCRTLVGHMTASITRLGPESLLILVFRSMAATLVEELKEAMEAVSARG